VTSRLRPPQRHLESTGRVAAHRARLRTPAWVHVRMVPISGVLTLHRTSPTMLIARRRPTTKRGPTGPQAAIRECRSSATLLSRARSTGGHGRAFEGLRELAARASYVGHIPVTTHATTRRLVNPPYDTVRITTVPAHRSHAGARHTNVATESDQDLLQSHTLV
jgi:hypothetical protein